MEGCPLLASTAGLQGINRATFTPPQSDFMLQPLPIDSHLDALAHALAGHPSVVLEAPPGTGKTTRVAPAFLPGSRNSAGWNAPSKILLVQPRRIAARAAAARIASEQGYQLGREVGYQVRFDNRTGPATRLTSLTPGILLRRLQLDSVLEDVSLILLDEFHERSLEYDLLLGMLQRIQTELRPDLRLLVMSATLDGASVCHYLGDAPRIAVAAQSYPVRIEHAKFGSMSGGRPQHPSRRIVEQTTAAVLKYAQARRGSDSAAEGDGDMLVFLPGVGEIRQVERQLAPEAAKQGWNLLTLFGDMRPADQDAVLATSPQRKIILATNVAETSLTIDGVTTVIDSGWARVQRVDPALGLNRLLLEPISTASATQRAGRAGRTAPGFCYRLWDEVSARSRPQQLDPEVLRVDIAGAVLQLLCWGESDIAAFPWITPPPTAAIAGALQVLEWIGAVQEGRPTELGRQLLHFPLHPRLARVVVAGHALRIPHAATLAAAILSERDIVDRQAGAYAPRSRGGVPTIQQVKLPYHCDVTRRVQALQRLQAGNRISVERVAAEFSLGGINLAAVQQVQRVAEQLRTVVDSQLSSTAEEPLETQLSEALLAGFPDRVARRRSANTPRGVMVGGRGIKLDGKSAVTAAELFLCLDVDAAGTEANVRMASAVEQAWLTGANLQTRTERFMNPTLGSVVSRRRLYWCDLMLTETTAETPLDAETARLLSQAAAGQFDKLLPAKDRVLQSWLARVRWLAQALPEENLPTFTGDSLVPMLEKWLYGLRNLEEVRQLPWSSLLPGELNAQQRKLLDGQAPEAMTLPTGRRVLLTYEPGKPPILAARIQEFFGWQDTPRLAGGKSQVLLHLLAPNGRVHQITDDLASFWANTYATVRKELRGRYPKHAWPEDPLSQRTPVKGSGKS
ncbi:ATP-dependent helicase HrpB [Aureliella helgolandensis]|uniref:ATP-dependent RNA helicase HrpB n=1 Tax=Aureliella helgolandensis TaxID=2527968 RepID=A0A518G5B8_9BACT|nr:ATP-dependent helicase HrpB [Aureliella helgolandensis]QDV23749.1 ATP-dependent RNA helicase HrpB [Aureliella helgolandensis]